MTNNPPSALRPVARLLLTLLPCCGCLAAKPAITTARSQSGFRFERIPAPAIDDAGARAKLELIDGRRDNNGGDATVLVDGLVPTSEDAPAANFFLAAGTDGGRIRLDLAAATEVGSIATYSWHRSTRAPQVYTLWAATGESAGFNPAPARDVDPAAVGWILVGEVDTRPAGDGGQHAALISDPAGGSLGNFRHLLFDLRRTEDRDTFGNTFLSEIDVVDCKAPPPNRLKAPEPVITTFTTPDRKFRFTIDATKAPDLMPWVEKELTPVIREWYPRMVAMMPSEGYTAPAAVSIEFKDDMGGTPAYATGDRLSFSIPFFRSQLKGEAKGCAIHELVHVIQNYGLARRNKQRPSPTPGWVTEGIADYIRWFLYEPEKQGAQITRRNLDSARHDASYRVSANFLDWVVREHDKDLLQQLNAAARDGRYDEQLWIQWTGKSLGDLGELWLKQHRERIGVDNAR